MEAFKPKPLLNKTELRHIKKSRLKVDGKKVVTDDVKKLKSLKVTPELQPGEEIEFYKEPIWIEYYIPKESRFAYETKFLYIQLVDPIPRVDKDTYLKDCMEKGSLVDVHQFMEDHPEARETIRHSYQSTLSIHERISYTANAYVTEKETKDLKSALYLTEALMKLEPTLASLEYFGNYTTYNLNWFIRQLNREKIEFSLEDTTVSLLIKRRNEFWDKEKNPEDEDFDLLSALFYEQAFPNRGAEELNPEDFLLH